ncbi:hypothetical protein VTN00DRAFT_6764 [Thermoascus crustaceus]|uniref:uncharacterized protein n=1 Tax=Thermoascus crustaceus TaxID=5088 RepID=UPI003744381B
MSGNPPLPPELFNRKPKVPWEYDQPFPQPFYYFRKETGAWTAARSTADVTATRKVKAPSKIRLITWNIDALVPFAEERMAGALEYLEKLYNQTQPQSETATSTLPDDDDDNAPPPMVIFLQEMLRSDLEQIQNAKWVQKHFYMTDIAPEFWENEFYGTTTLVEKRFPVQRVFRVHYRASRMQRDGLFVDVSVRLPGAAEKSENAEKETKILFLCNTHLESLVSNPPLRPVQMKVASTFMHGSAPHPAVGSEGGKVPAPPHAALLAGDLNAFAPEDLTAPGECGLQDTFLVLGGKDGTEESYTWGQQVPEELRKRFGCSRMDKILLCGGIEAKSLERIGAGVTVKVPDGQEEGPTERDEWVTDHLGLMGDFVVVRKDSKE